MKEYNEVKALKKRIARIADVLDRMGDCPPYDGTNRDKILNHMLTKINLFKDAYACTLLIYGMVPTDQHRRSQLALCAIVDSTVNAYEDFKGTAA